jgi:LacI family transcriptional regulator
MAIGALAAIRDAGLRPGIDVSVIGYDGLYAGLLTTPQLSTMEIAVADIGQRLADKLLQRVGGSDPRELQELLPVRQVPRASHGPLGRDRKAVRAV